MDERNQQTLQFNLARDTAEKARLILMTVFAALQEKGYDPINQIVGYIISGDPTYITSHKGARALVRHLERDELLEELIRFYITANQNRP